MKLPEDYDLDRIIESIDDYSNGFNVKKVYLFEDYQKIAENIPLRWQGLENRKASEVIDILWEGCETYFPNYINYLKSSLIALLWGETKWGLVLIYLLSEWKETSDSEIMLDGDMIGGVPITEKELALFESKNGRMPESLKALWKSHSFLCPKNGSLISGPNCGGDSNLFIPHSVEKTENQKINCFTFANVWKQFSYCFIKNASESEWEEKIVIIDKEHGVEDRTAFWTLDDILNGEI